MRKKPLLFPLIFISALILLYSCLLVPLFTHIARDIVLQNSLWFDAVDLLSYHGEILCSILIFTLFLFGIYRFPHSKKHHPVRLGFALIVFKHIAAIAVYTVDFGSLDLTGGLTPYLVALLIELVIALITVFLGYQLIGSAQKHHKDRKKASKTLDIPFEEPDPCYPFQKLISLKNPVLITILLADLIVMLAQLAAFTIDYLYGSPLKDGDLAIMFAYWGVLIILPCIYSYFLARLFFKACVKFANAVPKAKKKKKKTER